MDDQVAYIALKPPLPATVGPEARQAFVHAVGVDRLLLQGVVSTQPITLFVRLNGELDYRFELADLQPSPPYKEGRVTDPQGLAALADLRGILRKSQHIQICAEKDVEASDRYTGFSDVALLPQALPELAWEDVDTSVKFLGRTFAYPLLIAGMTGGLRQGAEINRRLARAAAALGIPMGVGSQRVALENPAHAAIFDVKKSVRDVFLIGNLGVAQLVERTPDEALDFCRRAVDQIECNALALHVNVLQEAIQVEGDRSFRDLYRRIERVASALAVPVLVKEVGAGIDVNTCRRLFECGVSAVDVGGKGGTSWSYIEGERARSEVTRRLGETFRDWGIPTAVAVWQAHRECPALDLVATGGIRDGLTVAKAVALGARMAGIGLPLFRAALESEEALALTLETFARGLKTAMLATGSWRLQDLGNRFGLHPRFREQLDLFSRPQRDS